MKNKELQETRMKGYFIQATRDILRGEGLKGISVRNIADRAGYSYATLYNYFKDVNDLVFICVDDFQEECRQFINGQNIKQPEGIERLKASILAYMGYFAEYPGIFDLFYLTRGGDFGNKQSIIKVIHHSLDDVCSKEWDYCLKNQLFTEDQIDQMKAQLRYSVIGILSLYLNRMTPKTYPEFIADAHKMIDYHFKQVRC